MKEYECAEQMQTNHEVASGIDSYMALGQIQPPSSQKQGKLVCLALYLAVLSYFISRF